MGGHAWGGGAWEGWGGRLRSLTFKFNLPQGCWRELSLSKVQDKSRLALCPGGEYSLAQA